jgi:hypothetical protein
MQGQGMGMQGGMGMVSLIFSFVLAARCRTLHLCFTNFLSLINSQNQGMGGGMNPQMGMQGGMGMGMQPGMGGMRPTMPQQQGMGMQGFPQQQQGYNAGGF